MYKLIPVIFVFMKYLRIPFWLLKCSKYYAFLTTFMTPSYNECAYYYRVDSSWMIRNPRKYHFYFHCFVSTSFSQLLFFTWTTETSNCWLLLTCSLLLRFTSYVSYILVVHVLALSSLFFILYAICNLQLFKVILIRQYFFYNFLHFQLQLLLPSCFSYIISFFSRPCVTHSHV